VNTSQDTVINSTFIQNDRLTPKASLSIHQATIFIQNAFSALALLVGLQEGIWSVKTEWWDAGMVICLE